MSNVAIKCENLGKKYKIGTKEKYFSFRDTIVSAIKWPYYVLSKKKSLKKDELWALRNVSFRVKKGEVIGVIGRNGAGKSTLLKLLCKITEPTEGKAAISGRVASLLEVGTGFHDELTGRENIYLNGSILGMKKKEIDRKFNEIVEFSGVEKFLDTPVKRYSSGMKVRLAFSVAAHIEPEILLIDEVLAVGDVEFQDKCLGRMSEVTKKSGRTILFVSHNMGAIQNLCSKCMLLENGRIKMFDETNKVVTQYLKDNKQEASIDLIDRKERKGSGDVIITQISFLDAETKKLINSVMSGQDITIKVDYETKNQSITKLSKCVFNLVFKNNYGIFVTGVNSKLADQKFKNLPARGSVYCHVPKLPLLKGSYNMKSSIHVNDTLVDMIEDAVTIDVEHGDYYNSGVTNLYKNIEGVFIPHSWNNNFNH